MLARLLAFPDRLAAGLAPRRWKPVFAVLLLISLIVVGIRYYFKIDEPSDKGTYTKSAFLRWQPQLRDLQAGVNIYQEPPHNGHPYPNPPIMALILEPFLVFPAYTGALIWLALKSALAFLGFRWVFRFASENGLPYPAPAAALACLLALHPIFGDLQHGNVNIFIAFLLFATIELFKRGLDLLAGVALALAIACKVTPALFIGYFGWKMLWHGFSAWKSSTSIIRGIWRGGGAVLLGTLVGLALWFFLVPGMVLGFERNNQLLKSWTEEMVKPFLVEGKVNREIMNQSFTGVAHRLFTPNPTDANGNVETDDDGKPFKFGRMLYDLGPTGVRLLIRGAQVLFVLTLFFLGRAKFTEKRGGLRQLAEMAFVALGMLLFSERTWKHHATTTILPMAVLVGSWALRDLGLGRKLFTASIIGLAVLCMTGPSLVSGHFQDRCEEFGVYLLGYLLLTLGMVVTLAAESRRS